MQVLRDPRRPSIDAAEAAKRLDADQKSVTQAARNGGIPGAFKRMCRWWFDEATFEAWRRRQGDPEALPASHFTVDPLPSSDDPEKGEGDAA